MEEIIKVVFSIEVIKVLCTFVLIWCILNFSFMLNSRRLSGKIKHFMNAIYLFIIMVLFIFMYILFNPIPEYRGIIDIDPAEIEIEIIDDRLLDLNTLDKEIYPSKSTCNSL